MNLSVLRLAPLGNIELSQDFDTRDNGLPVPRRHLKLYVTAAVFTKPNNRFPLPYDEVVVLEVKAPVGYEADVNKLLYPLKPRLARLSKYAQCCAIMGWQGDITSEI